MKKEFLDFLYENRAKTQRDIDTLFEMSKEPTLKCCENMETNNKNGLKLAVKRDEIKVINSIIEKYISLYSNIG